MKISNILPQFENGAALLLVVGKQDAAFYRAEKGEIEMVDGFHVEKPRYSDREGFFATRTGGKTIRSGSVYEAKDEVTLRDFFKELLPRLKRFVDQGMPERVFLFAPAHLKDMFLARLPGAVLGRIELLVPGNFSHLHPLELLKKIRDRSPAPGPGPVSETEKRILDLPRTG